VTFEGGHYERGLLRGQRLRDTLELPALPQLPEGFVRGCMRAAEAFYPPAVEEFEGLVRGGGFGRSLLMAYYFARLESRLGGCTMFAVEPAFRSDGPGPIVGRNYDWAVSDLRWCELQRYDADGSLRRIGYTHHWAGCADVLNESGLYLAIASLPPEPVRLPGVQWSIVVERVTECCATVAEAVAVCASVRHLRAMSYLLADAGGGVAVVEATPHQVRVRQAADGFVAATNIPQGGEPVGVPEAAPEHALPEPIGPASTGRRRYSMAPSRRRLQRARELLRMALPRVGEESVRRILSDHEAPICTGDHAMRDGGRWATIWSGVCRPAEGVFAIAPGMPCGHDYEPFKVAS
jgi:hypothetical protein